jgi:hypothetical protein
MGALHIRWEPYGAIGGLSLYGSSISHVRAMCNRMGAVMPYGSHMMPFPPSGAGWERWGWGGSREAMCTFGSIAAHLLPLWALLWQRNAGVGLAAGLYSQQVAGNPWNSKVF